MCQKVKNTKYLLVSLFVVILDQILKFWMLGWIAVFIIQLIINLIQVQSDSWWMTYWEYRFYIYLFVGLVTTFWIGLGGMRDMIAFFKALASITRNDADDGRVVNHHNVGENTPS